MQFALKVLMRTYKEINVILKLDYITSQENGMADAISRNNWADARKRIPRKGWMFSRQDPSAHISERERAIIALNSVLETLDYLSEDREGASNSKAHIENIELVIK